MAFALGDKLDVSFNVTLLDFLLCVSSLTVVSPTSFERRGNATRVPYLFDTLGGAKYSESDDRNLYVKTSDV